MAYTKIQLAAVAIFAAVVAIGGTVWLVSSSNSATTPNLPAETAASLLDNPTYPRLAPYSGVRWRGDVPEVQVDGKWDELVSLNDQPATAMVSFAQKNYKRTWQKHFSEDLVEMLTLMGHPPGNTVTLQLRTLDKNELVTLQNVAMTKENRQMIWQLRNN